MSMYPANWPRCPQCGEPALDGHITCGKVECDEVFWSRVRDAEWRIRRKLELPHDHDLLREAEKRRNGGRWWQ